MEQFKKLIEVTNDVHENVWAMLMILCAIGLACKGQQAIGGTLITGALAVFQRKS